MTQINGKPFSQLTNLNITGDFLVRGTALGEALLRASSEAATQAPATVDSPLKCTAIQMVQITAVYSPENQPLVGILRHAHQFQSITLSSL